MPKSNHSQRKVEHFDDTLETAPLAIYEIDYKTPRFKRVNRAMCVLSGYTEEELLLMNPADLLDAESAQRFKDRIKQGLAGQRIDESVEFKLKAKDGHDIWAILQVKPTYKDGKLDSALVVGYDISERKKAEETLSKAKSQYELIFNSVTEGFANYKLIFDKTGKIDLLILGINPAGAEQSGKKREEQIGKTWRQVWQGIPEELFDVYRQVYETGKSMSFEHFSPITKAWYIVTVSKSAEDQFVVTFFNITERKKSEEFLRESEERFRLVLKNSPINVSSQDLNLKYTWIYNPQLGYSPDDVIGKTDYDLLDSETAETVIRLKKQAIATGVQVRKEVSTTHGNNTLYYDFMVEPVQNEQGKIVGVNNIVIDITERKKAEEALKLSEERARQRAEELQKLMDIIPAAIWVSNDPECKVIVGNKAANQFYEAAGGENVSAGPASGGEKDTTRRFFKDGKELPPEELPMQEAASKNKEIKNSELEVLAPSGRKMTILGSAKPLLTNEGKVRGCLAAFIDITERKKVEEALALAKKQFETMVNSISDGLLVLDHNWRYTYVSQRAAEIVGIPREKMLGGCVWELFPYAVGTKFDTEYHKAVETGKTVHFEGYYPEPINQWLEVYCYPSEEGLTVFFHDITERKKAEEKIKAYQTSLEKLVEERTIKLELSSLYARNLIEASLDPLVTINADGKITDVNKATEQVTGCSRKELIGSDFSDYFTEPEKAEVGYKRVFTQGLVRDYPLAIKDKSGKVIEVLYNATIYRNDAGEIQGVFAAARDITEQKKAGEEAQEAAKKLKDSERLAAIGATAGMVGHDIRNPLQAITSDLYLAKEGLASCSDNEGKKEALESIVEIEKNIDYINKIVQDLQDYARPLNPNPGEADLKQIIEKLLQKNGIPENVKVTVKVEDDARKIVADSDYLNRILYNLVTNAVQAMPKGGKLSITAHKEANDIVIAVKDEGVGIPKDIQSKMFTPMFTTKSKGQGFGLPVVKRMTESLGGSVTFESQEGKGTTFTIRLPVKDQ